MESRTWKCEVCGKKFTLGEWTCADGSSHHVVEEKVYRVLDPPLDPGKPAEGSMMPIVRGRTVVCNIPPPKRVMENGEVKMVGEGSVEFINGVFSSKDPEIQYWLDKKPGYQATQEQWREKWTTTEEQLAHKELELQAARERLENERNELLAQVKREKTGVK